MPICLPEQCKLVQLASPETTNAGKTSDCISLKDALMVWLIVDLTQAVGHATLLTPQQATAVAAGDAKALTTNVAIWQNADCGATDTLVKATGAKNLTVAADVKDKQIVFQVDPAGLDLANSFDCLRITAADSSQATNFWNVLAVIQTRYPQATPPSAILD